MLWLVEGVLAGNTITNNVQINSTYYNGNRNSANLGLWSFPAPQNEVSNKIKRGLSIEKPTWPTPLPSLNL